MQKPPRRLPLRRLAFRAASAARRRPRTATAVLTLGVLVAIAIGGSLVLVSGQSTAADKATDGPTYTYADG